MENINIYVPSRGRSQTSKFLALCKEQNIVITIVVEPQEYSAYYNQYPEQKFMQLPLSNQGITYVRNFIKHHSLHTGESNYWQIDDDVTNVYRKDGTKLIKCDIIEAIHHCQEVFVNNNIAIGALDYRQFAWSATKQLLRNSFCDSFVYIDNKLTSGIKYREYVEGKEDRDIAMQAIKNNQKTARITDYAFSAPANGSNEGGLKDIFYDINHREEICVDRMIETWGTHICKKIIKDDGRVDCKILWNEIKSTQTSLF